ncbi:MFS transporter [Candidatus Kaiserbacteria bacterium]|nr:MFS transporter [Candidatus Kaiserbacteria bacterium]
MSPRIILFVGNFFFSMFAALPTFVLLPYLSSFMPAAYAGLVIAGGALVALALFPLQPRLVARYGAQQLALFFAVAEVIALLALATAPGAVAAALLIAVSVSLQPFLYYELDLLLEATIAEEGTTGRVRALFLTAWNIGGLTAPLLLGTLLDDTSAYGRVFLAAGALLIPFIVLFAARRLPRGGAPALSPMRDTFACIIRDRDFSAVTFGHFLLYLFFLWAPLYTPAYLHTELGIPWTSLGWMFSVMLIPYVVLQYPAGWIADRMIGDKELMFVGFLVAGGALAAIGLLSSASPIAVILLVLAASRVGAALVESMTEGHFFRRVTEKDINSVSIFRGIWPLANLVAPVAGSLILLFGNYQILFASTGIFLALAGSMAALLIKDFR